LVLICNLNLCSKQHLLPLMLFWRCFCFFIFSPLPLKTFNLMHFPLTKIAYPFTFYWLVWALVIMLTFMFLTTLYYKTINVVVSISLLYFILVFFQQLALHYSFGGLFPPSLFSIGAPFLLVVSNGIHYHLWKFRYPSFFGCLVYFI